MPTISSITLEPGSEYDFTTDEATIILEFTPGEWSGNATDHTILNSEDGITQAEVTLPVDIYVSYCDIANIAVTGPFKLYADSTCKNNGNNLNVIFSSSHVNLCDPAKIYVSLGDGNLYLDINTNKIVIINAGLVV
jgi:hypothetical protein